MNKSVGTIGRLRLYGLLMRLDRPVGVFLLLWPALWALWVAGGGKPDSLVFVVFVVGVVLMRSAGCVINDYADYKLDPHVARTSQRPIASGRVTRKEALILFVVITLAAFVLVLLLNELTILLSFVGAALAALYPFMKRYTHWPQAFLGLAFGWSIPMAFAAQSNHIPDVAWWMLLATVSWAISYDTMYAMVDRDDDKKVGIKSTAILFGKADKLMIALFQLITLAILYWLGQELGFGMAYYCGLAGAAVLAGYQQHLIRRRDAAGCFKAFLNNNWFGASIFAGLLVQYSTV